MREVNQLSAVQEECNHSIHINIPQHVDACRVEYKNLKKENRKSNKQSSFNIFSQPSSKTPVLPPMEARDSHPNSNCLVVDLLQLANSYSQGFKHDQVARRLSNFSGEELLNQPITTKYKPHHFDASNNSSPDSILSQKLKRNSKTLLEQQNVLVRNDHNPNKFAKSWPLAPFPRHENPKKLPKLVIDRHCSSNTSSNFSKDLKKFNRSRQFRMNKLSAVEENFSNAIQTKLDSCREQIEDGNEQNSKQRIYVSTRSKNISNCCEEDANLLESTEDSNIIMNKEKQMSPETTGSPQSDFTNVTKEVVMQLEDQASLQIYHYHEMIDTNKKCVKWLQDVAKERSENPDKIFLPHLLIP